MPQIKILPEDLVNKIAAGEVVERPASVIKELLDNAYDASASTISVEVEEGGMKKMLVVDNGSGMSKEDVELAFKAHATSKLFSEDDLLNIKNYGFRGEALSSIASVSKITLKSRRSGDALGTEIKIEGGNVISIEETGAPIGTSILVEDLFYNVPARREFVKSAQAEYRAILAIVEAHAMANAKVGMSFINNGKSVYSLQKEQQLEDRVKAMIGGDKFEKLVPLFFEHPHIEIYGFVGKPEMAGERRREQFIFVNGRHINDKQLAFAVKNAYGSLIPKTNYPVYFLFIDVPPNIVDVNVHPRKEEVKFSNSDLLFTSVRSAVKGALDRTNLTPGSAPKEQVDNNMGFPSLPTQQRRPMPDLSKLRSRRPLMDRTLPKQPRKSFADSFWDASPSDSDEEQKVEAPTKPINLLQVHNLYLVSESESGIEIYDQHAVHERILYEKLKKEHGADKSESQPTQGLLAPVVINLSVHESDILNEFKQSITSAGFKIEDFGPNTYKITEVPTSAVKLNIKELIHELLEDLDHDKEIKSIDNQSDKILTYLSCRMAYKAGDSLPLEEAAVLIEKLDETETSYTCPHGRPVKVELTLKELSKMFKRT